MGLSGDILGPLGPITAGSPGFAPRIGLIGLAMGGVLLGALYLLLRARNSPSPPQRPNGPALPENLAGREAPEFYARLMQAVRQGLAEATDLPTRTMTPRELADAAPRAFGGEDAAERWRALCGRAERAEFAGAGVEEQQRTEDLDFAGALLGERAAGHSRQRGEQEKSGTD